jgi:hypothetical protein
MMSAGQVLMRIRITQARHGSIDGVNLRVFHTGHTYEVEHAIASYLIVTGSAEPAYEVEPALVVRGGGREVCLSMVPAMQPDVAPDDEEGTTDPAA